MFSDQVLLLSARVFAVCKQARGHPLLHPSIARLEPSGDMKKPTVTWTLNSMIVRPIEVIRLYSLGIDVLADERYDTGVIHIVW
jgi:hypothetical protein